MEDIKNLVEKIKKKNDAKQKLNDYKWDEEFNFLIDSSDEEYEEKQKLEKELNEKDYPIFYKKHIFSLYFSTINTPTAIKLVFVLDDNYDRLSYNSSLTKLYGYLLN